MKEPAQVEQTPLHGVSDMPLTRRRRRLTDGWGWEVIAMLVSIACMASIIGILFKVDGKPLSYWTLFLSPSATLAIVITASKSTAGFTVAAAISQHKWLHFRSGTHPLHDLDLFDEAARGPLGAVRLLISGVPWRIACIGSLVVILALAVDTFVQQVVKLSPRDIGVDDGNALFAVNHGYFATAIPVWGANSGSTPNDLIQASSTDRFMPGAIYGGLFNTNSPRVFTCGSKCTWNETYVSLGFTSSCVDVTAATFKGQNVSLWEEWQFHGGATVVTPGGVNVSAEFSATSWQTVVSVGGIYRLRSVKKDPEGGVINNTRIGPEIARIAILRTPSDSRNNVILLNQTEVTECAISLAAYRYSGVSASGSNLTVSTEIIPLGDGLVTGKYKPPSDHDPKNANNTSFVLSYQKEGIPTLQATIPDLIVLGNFFNTTRFTGNVYDGETQPKPPSGVGDAFRSGNMSEIVQNMTLSMTNYLRSSFNVTGHGLSVVPVVFITVEWKWLVLPICVELAALAFLILTILDSRPRRDNSQQALWKASTVAVLCYYMRITSEEEGGRMTGVLRTDVENLDDLRRLARNTRAKLD